ncbi:hypothetical protein MKZ38_008190 [Zalerion maritima]|uniref:Uncharacterized protein n=1 Tax=Zalerion maritima TaxID=339359 RepID=A0AAD5RHG5_9PEZI|nr:hypothetical protein MKZ38_008190 [Zalerion maritima]
MHNPLPTRHQPVDNKSVYSHSRTRTTSSNIFPNPAAPNPMHLQQPSPSAPYHGYQAVAPNPYAPNPYGTPPSQAANARRSPSVNTFNSFASNPNAPPTAYRTSPTHDLRRSISSRSGNVSPQPVSYVALLRKQKATVWCDRSQYEDPRVLAHFKAAKAKASMDLAGGGHGGTSRTNTGMSAGKLVGKVRHHNKPGTTSYTPEPNNYVGVGGVPMRLSATEVEGEDSDDDDTQVGSRLHHRRTGSSGRSSTASIRRANQFRSSGSLNQRRWSPGHTPERSGSLVQENVLIGPETVMDDRASGKARSTGSGSSAERADNVADLGNAPKLASNSLMHHALTREKSVRNPEDLKRRGSVDERTMTLTSGRLFIANPD